jgi:hypothetical protein
VHADRSVNRSLTSERRVSCEPIGIGDCAIEPVDNCDLVGVGVVRNEVCKRELLVRVDIVDPLGLISVSC